MQGLPAIVNVPDSPGRHAPDAQTTKPQIIALPEADSFWYRAKRLMLPWLRFDPECPPGPVRGDAWGDQTFATSLAFDADFEGLDVTCRITYHFDPACCLTVLIDTPDGYQLYWFETRAFSLRYALTHLQLSAREQRIALPLAGLHPNARWLSKKRDCTQVTINDTSPRHACLPPTSQTSS